MINKIKPLGDLVHYLSPAGIVEAAWLGYVLLLRFPGPKHIQYDTYLAIIRDRIAGYTSQDAEYIQRLAEVEAARMGPLS